MKLQTTIPFQPERNPIDYGSKVLLLGSCFTENIGAKLSYFKFQTLQNPFGIIFNPVAIEKIVTRAINQDYFAEEDIFFHNELWHSFEVHSGLSHADKDDFLLSLNKKLDALSEYLKEASHIILTYGTSWVYRHIESDTIVANCHKVPNKKFLKEILSVRNVSESIDSIVTLVASQNREVVFVNTVSPVRHIKDGFIENGRSKAHLISGIHELVEPRAKIHYFPSYEIMMDELRDYRFYTSDMLHPNEIAIEIIWNHFKMVWIASETEDLQKKVSEIQLGLQHRPFHPDSKQSKLFKENLQQKIKAVISQIPHITFSE